MKHLFLYVFLIFLAPFGMSKAQPTIIVKGNMDSTRMWIGNQTILQFQVIQDAKQKVTLPLFSDTIVGALEIVQQQKLDTIKLSDTQIQVNVGYIVTSFHDSLIYVPPYPFVSGSDTVWSNSMSIKTIQPFKIDTASNAITDIKPVFKPKFDWADFFKKFFLVILAIALLILLFFIARRFMEKKPILLSDKSKPQVSPHTEALEKLDKIKNGKIWQQGRIKEYHTELTDVVRYYIERAFDVNSMEATSEEILQKMQFLRADKPAAYDSLKQILQLGDLVKFAKWNPAPNDNELSLMNAYLFVNQTKTENTPPSQEEEVEENVNRQSK